LRCLAVQPVIAFSSCVCMSILYGCLIDNGSLKIISSKLNLFAQDQHEPHST
jgi:hypothetical protein